jgi:hypothetical protein
MPLAAESTGPLLHKGIRGGAAMGAGAARFSRTMKPTDAMLPAINPNDLVKLLGKPTCYRVVRLSECGRYAKLESAAGRQRLEPVVRLVKTINC